ncbi:MAG: hypothetical protein JXA07_00205 [Spirochaetes bacterium]|nr:hypothetical protein [Spirochaetota bacterium]
MKIPFLFIIMIISLAPAFTAESPQKRTSTPLEQLEGITHYGMPIEEIRKKFHKDKDELEIIYSNTHSDDNMDDYVREFYDDLLREIEAWLYKNSLPAREVKIIISNCKFCRIGYCLKKNRKELSLISYFNNKKVKEISYTHTDLIETGPNTNLARSAVHLLLEK